MLQQAFKNFPEPRFVFANGSMSSSQSGECDILEYKCRTIATLRDTLLLKLVSGGVTTTPIP